MSYDLLIRCQISGADDLDTRVVALLDQVGVKLEFQEGTSFRAHDGGYFPISLELTSAFRWPADERWRRPIDTGFELEISTRGYTFASPASDNAAAWIVGAALAIATGSAVRDPQLGAELRAEDLPTLLDAAFDLRWPSKRPPPAQGFEETVVVYGKGNY